MSARSDAEKEETKEIALVLVCLYATFTRRWDHYVCKWQLLHHYIVSIIQVKSKLQKHTFKSDPDKVSQNGDFIWVSLICQDLNQLNKGNHIPNDDTATGFLELLSCIEDLSNIIRINESKLNIIQSNKTCKYSNIYTNNVLLKSVKLATEKNYRTFLHLLFTIGEQSLDVQLNNLIRSLPLHHAAATGNFCAILYLSVTAKAYGNVLDRNNNTPAHLAYMNGYRYIGDYICKNVQNVKSMKNNAGQTPTNIREAFQEYEKLYNIVKEEEETDESVNLTEQIDGMSLTTRLLDHWLSKSKSMSFRKIMDNSIVNYSFGEAKLVQSLVIDFAKSIGNKIAEYNPLLKGTLVLVGSAGDNVRLNAPDESDCTWLLDWKNVRVILEDMSEEDQKFKHYKHSIRAESDDMEINRLLEGTNLLEEFYNQTLKAVSELLPNLDPRISLILPRVKRIGCGVCITLAWAGTTYPMLMVDMDLVPAIKASRPANFTHPPLTKNIVDPRLDAIVVVQTHIKSGEIRCSTTLEEQVVMQRLSTGQHLVFIIAKLLVSKLKTEKWASKLFRERFTFFSTKQFKLPAPTGFLLKSSFFQELENVPNPDDWEENCIVDRLKGIFFSMCKKDDKDKLHSGLIPSYFSSTIQPPAAGFMAPAICKFILDNEKELRKMEDSTSDRNEAEELQQLAVMWNMALNKYYNID
ncbi:unnamed protein product [Meganyctiphanes norvegica]|uniref:ANK_REP_REGION domain-containing protein n=1 Tax=Meganyctiphanes norvegica TaxID=48144 RepID=A0AAV2S938_MEGNR